MDAARATLAGTQEVFMASFMVDLNTVPTTRVIDVAEQDQIWDTLAAEALRLRDVGSIEGLREQ